MRSTSFWDSCLREYAVECFGSFKLEFIITSVRRYLEFFQWLAHMAADTNDGFRVPSIELVSEAA